MVASVKAVVENARASVVLAVIAASTVVVCAYLYPLGIARLLLPECHVRRALGLPLDWAIDAWVLVARAVVRVFRVTDLRVHIPAESRGMDKWNLVVSNHQSWADILILQSAFLGVIPCLKFFTKRQLIWMPFLGFGLWLLGFPYVFRLSPEQLRAHPEWRGRDRKATLERCSRFHERPVSVLIFAEGTRFTEAKKLRSGSPYRNLLQPRLGGTSYVLESLGSKVPTLLDVTIRYEGRAPGFWEFLQGRCPSVDLSVVRRAAPSADRASVEAWLSEAWEQKDRDLGIT